MDWKDKLKEIKELFPVQPSDKPFIKKKRVTVKTITSLQKDIRLSEEVLEMRMRSKVGFVCREFNITKEQLADVLYLGNFHLNINNERARITPGMYLHLSKNLEPGHYELNKDSISTIINKYIATNAKKKRKTSKKTVTKRLEKEVIRNSSKSKKNQPPVAREPNVKYVKTSTSKEIRYLNNFAINTITNISKTIFVNFEDILFDDYMIRVKNGSHVSMPHFVKQSRKSLLLLKKYFKKLKLNPIEVLLEGGKIKKVQNLDQLNEGIEYLHVIKYYFDNNNKINPASAEKLIEKLDNISNSTIKRVASLDSIEGYFDYLNDLQLTDHKIVPVVEIINTGKQTLSEDTYLYTIATKSKESILIIWESSVQGRATYVFLSNKDKYLEIIQSIFDFISSNRRAKRSTLRKNDPDNLEMIDCIGRIKHQSFEHWKLKLGNYIDEY